MRRVTLVVLLALLPAVTTTANINATEPTITGVRATVPQAGLYSVALAQLAQLGVPTSWLQQPQGLRVWQGDHELPRQIDNERMYVYVPPYATRQTDAGGFIIRYTVQSGLSAQPRTLAPATSLPHTAYTATLHLEQQHIYVSHDPVMPDADHWFWFSWYTDSTLQPTPFNIDFALPEPTTAPTAVLRLRLHGGYFGAEHRLQLALNGSALPDVVWRGRALRQTEVPIAAILLNSTNTLTLTPAAALIDSGYLDWIELDQQQPLDATAGNLIFTGSSGSYSIVPPSAPFDLWDVTEPWAAQPLSGWQMDADQLTFSDTESRRYLLQARQSVQSLVLWTEPDLRAASNTADYLALGPGAWQPQIEPLLRWRAEDGLRPLFVDVQWMYDQFGDGRVEAAAIKRFLTWAYDHWTPPTPRYVLLVGDGTYDPHGYAGGSDNNIVPPFLAYVDPWIGETAADNRYVDFDGDRLPEMHIGRFPVRTLDDVAAMVAKTLAYEQADAGAAWVQRVVLVADDADGAGDFPALAADVATLLPPNITIRSRFYDPAQTVAAFRATLLQDFNDGALLVNYTGHAGMDAWADEALLRVADVELLNDAPAVAVVLSMTCLDGSFHIGDALAETLVRQPNGGAVAMWSSTGLGVATGHEDLDRGIIQAIFDDGVRRLGPATLAGKQAVAQHPIGRELLDTYVLFGDPAMRLALPFVPVRAVDDSVLLIDSSALLIDVVANDINPYAHELDLAIVTPPHFGTATLESGTLVRYTPAQSPPVSDLFQYRITDPANGSTAVGTVLIVHSGQASTVWLPLIGH